MAGVVNRKRGSQTTSQAERAAALARLVHEECTRLLELYRERESLPSVPVTGDPLVSIPPFTSQHSTAEKVGFLYSALKQCLRLLDNVIGREGAEFVDGEESEYRKQWKTVRVRLGHLLVSTGKLLVDTEGSAALVPEAEVKEEMDGILDGGSFALKMWTLRVLQELLHWSDTASETFQFLLAEQEKTPKRMNRRKRTQLK